VSYMKATFKTAASIGIRLTGVDRLVGALTGSSRIPAVISYHRVVEISREFAKFDFVDAYFDPDVRTTSGLDWPSL